MKSRSTLPLVLLNVAWLAVASWFLARHFRDGGGGTQVQFVTNYVPMLKAQRATEVVTNTVTNVVAATNDFRWAQLESEDYRAYVARLRAIGCPEQTIRDIVIADVDKMLAPKMLAAAPVKDVNYWQPIEQDLWEDAEQKDAWRKQRAVDFEKREVIRELLGVDLIGERLRVQGQEDYYGQRLGFLPEEKRARVRLALDQFGDQERTLLEQQVEEGSSLGNAELARLRQQKDAAVAQQLTPQEQEQYDLWFSPAAAIARDQVYGMSASEDEFLKLYQLRKNFVQRYGDSFGPNDPGWNEYQAQLRQSLGDQRYSDFVRAQDSDYREILRVTARFKLSPEVAAQLYSYKQPAQEAQAAVDADATLTPDQRAAATQAIADEAQRAFRETLGDKAFRQLMRRTSNPWLRGTHGAKGVATAER